MNDVMRCGIRPNLESSRRYGSRCAELWQIPVTAQSMPTQYEMGRVVNVQHHIADRASLHRLLIIQDPHAKTS
jgi:hypothetical protein